MLVTSSELVHVLSVGGEETRSTSDDTTAVQLYDTGVPDPASRRNLPLTPGTAVVGPIRQERSPRIEEAVIIL